MNDILAEWDKSTGQARLERLRVNLKRRQFLHNSLKASAGLTLLPSITLFSGCEQDPRLIQADIVRQDPWQTFAAVQLILFPDDGNGPGAIDLNATAYLKFVLDAADTDKEDREFILKGVNWINELTRTHNQIKFAETSQQQQVDLVKKISTSSSGEHWLSFLLSYIFEALLADPVYGGNPHAIGWKWLEHKPGFPRPPRDKTYIELLNK